MASSQLHPHILKEKKDRFWICSVCKTNHLVRSTRYSCKQCTYHQCRNCFEENQMNNKPVAANKPELTSNAQTCNEKRFEELKKEVENPQNLGLVSNSGDSVRLVINNKGKKYILPELIQTSFTIKQLKIKINQLLRIPVITLHRRDTEFGDNKYLYECDFADDDELIVNKGLTREEKVENSYQEEIGACEINKKVPYNNLEELQEDLQKCGLESSNLILGLFSHSF